jgi:hypothetical protein
MIILQFAKVCTSGLVDENNNLSMPGLLVLALAMRKQQADARSRA